MKTVLVTSGGGLQGMAVIEALRRLPQTRVVLVDCLDENIGRFHVTRFVRVPLLRDEAAFIDSLDQICRDEEVDLIFPATELELEVLDRHRARLQRGGAVVMVSRAEVLAIGKDKMRLHEWSIRSGLPTLPTTLDPCSLPLPLIGKPRLGWGGRGIVTLESQQQRQRFVDSPDANMAWQPWLEDFTEVSVDFAIAPDGRVSPLSARSRLRTLSGFAFMGQPVDEGPVLDLARRAALALASEGGLGLFNLQFLSASGQWWLSDLNPRVGTSMPLSLAAGYNPVAFLMGHDSQPTPGRQPLRRTFRALHERAVPRLALEAVRAVVFDLDDTLLDQKDWIARKLEGAWQTHQSALPSRCAFMRAGSWLLEEGHRADLLDAMCRHLELDETVRLALIDAFRSFRPSGCRLYDDVQPCLHELRRRGYRLALLTDNPAPSQRMKIEVAKLADRFDALVLTGTLGVAKPDARTFMAACAAINVGPAQAVMVGDNLYRDSLGALDAGFAHAFHIHQDGAMFDFAHPVREEMASGRPLTAIRFLTELLWHLEGLHT